MRTKELVLECFGRRGNWILALKNFVQKKEREKWELDLEEFCPRGKQLGEQVRRGVLSVHGEGEL